MRDGTPVHILHVLTFNSLTCPPSPNIMQISNAGNVFLHHNDVDTIEYLLLKLYACIYIYIYIIEKMKKRGHFHMKLLGMQINIDIVGNCIL